MLPKSDQARINQTLRYIEKTSVVPAAVRAGVHKFAKNWTDVFMPKRQSGTGSYKDMQAKMTMKSLDDPGEKEARKQRRAMVLLWQAMMNSELAQRSRSMPDGEVAPAFLSCMRKAKAKADMDSGISVGNQDIFDNHFRRDPGAFLDSNVVVIYGIKADKQPADNVGAYFFSYQLSKDRYVIQAMKTRALTGLQRYRFPQSTGGTCPAEAKTRTPGVFPRSTARRSPVP